MNSKEIINQSNYLPNIQTLINPNENQQETNNEKTNISNPNTLKYSIIKNNKPLIPNVVNSQEYLIKERVVETFIIEDKKNIVTPIKKDKAIKRTSVKIKYKIDM
jgi:hypothetical protein